MSRVILIGGPTASGKSALALELARRIGGEIVNADSMQLYRDLHVLTARPTRAEEALAPHHLYGVADAAEAWSAGRWLTAATDCLAAIARGGRPAIVVGGTGLYLRALTHGLAPTPAIPPEVRQLAARTFDQQGEAQFRASLRERDPAAEARISPGDRQRLSRAWEVFEFTSRALTDWQSATAGGLPAGSVSTVLLEPPRPDLYSRCDDRVLHMLAGGALDEARALAARALDPVLPAMKAVGLRELTRHLDGELTLDQAIALARQATRNYAKRQMTWFRRQTPDWPRITDDVSRASWLSGAS